MDFGVFSEAFASVFLFLWPLPGYRMKNKTMADVTTKLVAEVKLDETGMAVLEELRGSPNVKEISVMDSLAGSIL